MAILVSAASPRGHERRAEYDVESADPQTATRGLGRFIDGFDHWLFLHGPTTGDRSNTNHNRFGRRYPGCRYDPRQHHGTRHRRGTSDGERAGYRYDALPGADDAAGDQPATVPGSIFPPRRLQPHDQGIPGSDDARGFFPVGTGDYGPNTLAMVKRLQAQNGLIANGEIGPNTWKLAWTGSYNPNAGSGNVFIGICAYQGRYKRSARERSYRVRRNRRTHEHVVEQLDDAERGRDRVRNLHRLHTRLRHRPAIHRRRRRASVRPGTSSNILELHSRQDVVGDDDRSVPERPTALLPIG